MTPHEINHLMDIAIVVINGTTTLLLVIIAIRT